MQNPLRRGVCVPKRTQGDKMDVMEQQKGSARDP